MSNGGAQVRIGWPEDIVWPQGGYGNVFAVNHTPWDFTLRIGFVALPNVTPQDLEAAPGPVTVEASAIAQITLSPVAMAQLAAVLQANIATYVASFGPIGGSPEQGLT